MSTTRSSYKNLQIFCRILQRLIECPATKNAYSLEYRLKRSTLQKALHTNHQVPQQPEASLCQLNGFTRPRQRHRKQIGFRRADNHQLHRNCRYWWHLLPARRTVRTRDAARHRLNYCAPGRPADGSGEPLGAEPPVRSTRRKNDFPGLEPPDPRVFRNSGCHTQPKSTSTQQVRTRGANGKPPPNAGSRSEEHTSELQSRGQLVCRLL